MRAPAHTARSAGRAIRIAAALIDDDAGRLLLVRKNGTRWFMQAGGKIEVGESPLDGLRRELREEIGVTFRDIEARHLGAYTAPAANEPGRLVEADIFHLRLDHSPEPRAEIAEAIWVTPAEATAIPLAPLTRGHILTLAAMLRGDADAVANASASIEARPSPR